MQRILKRFLKQNIDQRTNYRGPDPVPIPPWKRNSFAAIFGITLGVYIGQYFPDVFYEQTLEYLPDIEALNKLAPHTAILKPNPDYPQSLTEPT